MAEPFQNKLAVWKFLDADGWAVKKSAFYNHCGEGKLKPGKGGAYTARAVAKYAKTFLKRKNTGKTISGETDDLQRQKLEAEIKKLDEQGRLARQKRLTEEGRLVSRSRAEAELAGRAAVLAAGFKHLAETRTHDWIAAAGGDVGNQPALLKMVKGDFIDLLDEYAKKINFTALRVKN